MVVTRSRLRAQTDSTKAQHARLASSSTTKKSISNKTLPAEAPASALATRITSDRPATLPQPPGLPFTLQTATFGLIQERIRDSLFALVVQAILWNQTRGLAARPVLFTLLAEFPTPAALAEANLASLTKLLQPLGLHRQRAARLVALGRAWIAAPPCKERRYRRLHYPCRGAGSDVKPDEVLCVDDARVGWEIAHLPGMGPYALDSYRIFYRDRLRGVAEDDDGSLEPEWKRVTADDKDLKAYLKWKWAAHAAETDLMCT